VSFYQRQDNARKKTGLLVFYFISAVVLIIAAVNTAVYVTLFLSSIQKFSFTEWLHTPYSWGTALVTLLAIAAGSLIRMAQLSKGGVSVALMAGGIPVDPATQNERERVLINVVEEMAIASGTPVPRIFIMREEMGINAFVAGTEPRNTVLAVTQGTLDQLSRDELQGVIGHEFSHILNGDMILNVRLIGILAGILFIGQIGEFLLRGNRHGSYSRSYSNNKRGNQLMPIALALLVIGYVGLFFGRLIKAAISRQREYLADASSVQFTRNPEGIASALYAIQHYSGHSLLMNAHAEDMNHMCFGETVKMRLSGLLATHPPIEKRINAIDNRLMPRLKARFQHRPIINEATPRQYTIDDSAQSGFSGTDTNAAPTSTTHSSIKASVGQPTPEHHAYAQQLHQHIPASIKKQTHKPESAELVLYGLLLLDTKNPQQHCHNILSELGQNAPQQVLLIKDQLQNLDISIRLPLLDITIATLKGRDRINRKRIVNACIDLIKADNKITLSEFVYCYLIQQGLAEIKRPPRTIKSYQHVEQSLATLFSALVQVSGDTLLKQSENFQQIMRYYSKQDFTEQLKKPPSPKALSQAFHQLHRLTPLLKQPIVDACVDCIWHDKKAVTKELELLRAICEALECPMPPILTTHEAIDF
jgi:Zn-dependent protease with chaperone function